MNPSAGQRGRCQVTLRKHAGGIVRDDRNFVELGGLLDFGGKIYDRFADLREADEHAATHFLAWSAANGLHSGNDAAGRQPADVNHFIWLYAIENSLQAACARPLLDDERDRERSLQL